MFGWICIHPAALVWSEIINKSWCASSIGRKKQHHLIDEMGLWLIRFSSSRHRDQWSWMWIFAVCCLGSFHQSILCWLCEPDSWWLQSKQRSTTSSSSGLRHNLSGMSWSLFSIGYAWNALPGTIPGGIGVRWSKLLHWLRLMWMRRGYQMTALAAPYRFSKKKPISTACMLSVTVYSSWLWGKVGT